MCNWGLRAQQSHYSKSICSKSQTQTLLSGKDPGFLIHNAYASMRKLCFSVRTFVYLSVHLCNYSEGNEQIFMNFYVGRP